MSIIEEYPAAPLKLDFRYAKTNRRESSRHGIFSILDSLAMVKCRFAALLRRI